MKITNVIFIISLCSFYYLLNQFLELGGLSHRLLKILFELLIVLFIMIILKYQNEIKEISDWDKNQKKILDYFTKNGK